jgi:hypothetical protein
VGSKPGSISLEYRETFRAMDKQKEKAGTSRSRPSCKRLNYRCQYIRGQRSETNVLVKSHEPVTFVRRYTNGFMRQRAP